MIFSAVLLLVESLNFSCVPRHPLGLVRCLTLSLILAGLGHDTARIFNIVTSQSLYKRFNDYSFLFLVLLLGDLSIVMTNDGLTMSQRLTTIVFCQMITEGGREQK